MAKNNSPDQVKKREQWAWYFYDFGNSAYAAVVLLAVYSVYFKEQVVGGAEGSRLWGFAIGIAMLVVAITSPILGSIADYSGAKKKFLLFYTSVACVFTALLFFVEKGSIFLGMLFFIIAEIGYRSAQVFYNSILPEIASEKEIGRVSGNGWAFGSLGGIVCLLVVLAFIMLIGGSLIVRLSLVFTAIFFAAASIPAFITIKEKTQPKALPEGSNYISLAFSRLGKTFKTIKNYKEYIKFIIAFLVYNDGILMALNFAAIFGAVIFGMDQQQLIIFMIIVQVASVAGAYFFGFVSDKIGGKNALYISLSIMIAAVIGIYFNNSLTGFFIIGGVAGFALTAVQSVSRAMVGLLAPKGQSAEFYGFFAVAGRTSSFIGPAVYGWVAAETALLYQSRGHLVNIAEQMGQRTAMLSIIIFLVIGMILLITVNNKRLSKSQISEETN